MSRSSRPASLAANRSNTSRVGKRSIRQRCYGRVWGSCGKDNPAPLRQRGYTSGGRLLFSPRFCRRFLICLCFRGRLFHCISLFASPLGRARFFSSQRFLTGFVSAAFFSAFIASSLAASVFSVSGEMRLRDLIAALPRCVDRGRINL
jgi:hypothetical protein